MLSKATVQLVEEVMGYFGEERREKAREDPEACIVSMLTVIKNRLPKVYATLSQTIEMTTYDEYLKEAREKIEQAEGVHS